MKAVVQRVSRASVSVNDNVVGQIRKGLVVLLGVTHDDTEKEVDWMVNKIVNIRIFPDKYEKMNLSVKDIKGELLIVSQFTLYGDAKKGNRPSFVKAASPERAERLYNMLGEKCRNTGIKTDTGKFGAMMNVEMINDGPVTIVLEN